MRTLIALLPTLLLISACQGAVEPTSPEGGFDEFREALLTQDGERLWEALSSDTQLLFEDALEARDHMRGLVRRLRPGDRPEAWQQAGLTQLERFETPKDLFFNFLDPTMLPTERAFEKGLRIREVERIEDSEDIVLIHAHNGQTFEFLRHDDERWRVRNPLHDVLAESLSRIERNRASLEIAVSRFGVRGGDEEDVRALFGYPERNEP